MPIWPNGTYKRTDDVILTSMAIKFKPTRVVLGIICCCGIPFSVIVKAIMVAKSQHTRPHNHWDASIDISPNGKEMVIALPHDSMDIYIYNLETKAISPLVSTANYEWAPRFSSDGMKIVYSGGIPGDRADHIFVYDRKSKSIIQVTSGDFNDTSPSFYDNDNKIFFAREDHYRWGGMMSSWDEFGPIYNIDLSNRQVSLVDRESYFRYAITPAGRLINISLDSAKPTKQLKNASTSSQFDLQLDKSGDTVLIEDDNSSKLSEVSLLSGKKSEVF